MLKRFFIPKRCLFHGSKSILVPNMTWGRVWEGFTVNLDTRNAMFRLPLCSPPGTLPRTPPGPPPPPPPGWQRGRAGKGLPCDNDNDKLRIGAMPCAKMTEEKGKNGKKGTEQMERDKCTNLSHTPTGRRNLIPAGNNCVGAFNHLGMLFV